MGVYQRLLEKVEEIPFLRDPRFDKYEFEFKMSRPDFSSFVTEGGTDVVPGNGYATFYWKEGRTFKVLPYDHDQADAPIGMLTTAPEELLKEAMEGTEYEAIALDPRTGQYYDVKKRPPKPESCEMGKWSPEHLDAALTHHYISLSEHERFKVTRDLMNMLYMMMTDRRLMAVGYLNNNPALVDLIHIHKHLMIHADKEMKDILSGALKKLGIDVGDPKPDTPEDPENDGKVLN